METQPRYVWMAELLRRPILSGELAPGDRLPSRSRLARAYDVSEQVSRHALRLLVDEGLVEARPGAGYFVRSPPDVHRFPRTDRFSGAGVGPLHAAEYDVATERAAGSLARRLVLQEGAPVFRTRTVGTAEGEPVAVHTAWEPTSLTKGTLRSPVDAPEAGVLDRLAGVGVAVDRVVEEVGVRPLRAPEAVSLRLPPGRPMLVVERTHYSQGRPVETSDLVGSVDQCRLVYRLGLTRPRWRRP